MPETEEYAVYTVPNVEAYPLPPFSNHHETKEQDTRDLEKRPIFTTGWYAGCIFGIICLLVILCVSLIPKHGYLQMQRPATLYFNWTKQGALNVYPSTTTDKWSAIGKKYVIVLRSESDTKLPIQQIQDVYSTYIQRPVPVPYVLCDAQLPKYDAPCFFEVSQFGRSCTPETKFGYQLINGTMNPCFIIRVENATDWAPETVRGNIGIPDYVTVGCQANGGNSSLQHKVNLFPESGFLLRFFPASQFNSNLYIGPAVMVQVEKVALGENVTVTCWLNALNAFHLAHDGKISVIFTNEPET